MIKIALSTIAAALVLTVAAPLAFAQDSAFDKGGQVSNFAPSDANNTVFLKVNKDGSTESFTTTIKPANEAEAKNLVLANQGNFVPNSSEQMTNQPYSELDKTTGKPSNYWVGGGYYGGFGYPVYNWGYYPVANYGYQYPYDYSSYWTIPPCDQFVIADSTYYGYNSAGWGWPGYYNTIGGFYGYGGNGGYYGQGGYYGNNGRGRYYGNSGFGGGYRGGNYGGGGRGGYSGGGFRGGGHH
jgi:hypothetical protein